MEHCGKSRETSELIVMESGIMTSGVASLDFMSAVLNMISGLQELQIDRYWIDDGHWTCGLSWCAHLSCRRNELEIVANS